MNALATALKQIEANAQREADFAVRLALDSRYQFLLRTAQANDVEFDDSHHGFAGMESLVSYHQTGAPYRRQRAKALLNLRRAFLFNGYRGMGKRVDEITHYRRSEKHRDGVALCDANLAAVDATLSREHSQTRVGATSVGRGV